jgi:hypothetical protein
MYHHSQSNRVTFEKEIRQTLSINRVTFTKGDITLGQQALGRTVPGKGTYYLAYGSSEYSNEEKCAFIMHTHSHREQVKKSGGREKGCHGGWLKLLLVFIHLSIFSAQNHA